VQLEEITEVLASSKGIIELGSLTLFAKEKEYYVDIEESNIRGWHRFRVFLNNPDLDLDPEQDPETGEILDLEFIRFIEDHYRALSGH
jgi:hypothetical protein